MKKKSPGLLLLAQALIGLNTLNLAQASESSDAITSYTHSYKVDRTVFMRPTQTVKQNQRMDFVLGKAIFEKIWVSSPASTQSSDGLGPLYNARSCLQCHIANGRGRTFKDNGELHRAFVAKFYGIDNLRDAVYGAQLQSAGVAGIQSEGHISVSYQKETVTLADGTSVTLRKPSYTLVDLGYGTVEKNTRLSYRVAPPMIGAGVINKINESDILALEDAKDRDSDGISGRANSVLDRKSGEMTLGRFGWKAEQPNTRQQNSAAFSMDIGLSTTLFSNPWGDCSDVQVHCVLAPHGIDRISGAYEVSEKLLDVLSVYVNGLAIPAQRDRDAPDVKAGERLFKQSGCVSCHRESYTIPSSSHHGVTETVRVWSDLLLHDMGEGLADAQAKPSEIGREWRTQPLWGIGLTQFVESQAGFLHDGRARTLLEAVLWHGGEAQMSRDKVIAMNALQRRQLITFLESL